MNPAQVKKDLVLVVDDSPDSLGMINDTLDAAGLTVLVALEGGQALNIAQSITPDIILMDALMPNMDGFETCRQFKAISHLAHIPVIFMTGLSDTESIVKGFDAGGVDYIQKPVNGDELIARMRVHLTNARLTQSARIALDSAGQFLIATDRTGQLKWATPQAQELFASAALDARWQYEVLQTELAPMFAHVSSRDKGIVIKAGTKAIEVRYISEAHGDEHLLRLIDHERPSDEQIIKAAFELTERESEVLIWLARGKSNAEIAIILGVSPRTVNKHLEQVFRKLGVENRTSAAVMALKQLESR
jgi:DNA-binding NarL/FixJ family response regulator